MTERVPLDALNASFHLNVHTLGRVCLRNRNSYNNQQTLHFGNYVIHINYHNQIEVIIVAPKRTLYPDRNKHAPSHITHWQLAYMTNDNFSSSVIYYFDVIRFIHSFIQLELGSSWSVSNILFIQRLIIQRVKSPPYFS